MHSNILILGAIIADMQVKDKSDWFYQQKYCAYLYYSSFELHFGKFTYIITSIWYLRINNNQ